MYITTSQLKAIEDLLDNPTDLAKEKVRLITLELRGKQKILNKRTRENIAKHRVNDPLYGRSAEYKAKRLEKARQIIKIYGKEGN